MKCLSFFIILRFIALSILVIPLIGLSQTSDSELILSEQFERGKALLDSFKNDSAIAVFDRLLLQLEGRKKLETAFGLRVQLRKAEALEKDERDEEAIQLLLRLKENSKAQGIWDVYANTCVTLARQYEKFKETEECLQHLRLAQEVITREKLEAIYPFFAVRIASYHRMFANKDSALYYASEAIRTAAPLGLTTQEADGHLVKGHVLRQTGQANQAIPHYQRALRLFRSLENYTSMSYMYASLTVVHRLNKQLDAALRYNDSTLLVCQTAMPKGLQNIYMISAAHLERSRIYEKLNKLDSALYFQELGYEERLQYAYNINEEKVKEIEARYLDATKATQIQEQAAEIRQQRSNRNYLIGVILVILLFLTILLRYNRQLQKAKQKTDTQAKLIRRQNEELQQSLTQQLVLQGEVHHRVKNNLQVIVSLLELQQEDIVDPLTQKKLEAMSNRIYSMAAIHEILYQQEDKTQLDFAEYVQNLCLHFSNFSLEEDKPTYHFAVNKQELNLATSMPLGIILTELLTNSLKYARITDRKLMITIGLERVADQYCLSYQDNGPGFPKGELTDRKGGLGSFLLRSMARQLKGAITTSNQDGASFRLSFKERKL